MFVFLQRYNQTYLEKKNIKKDIINKKENPKIVKKIILKPETKIIVIQVNTNNNV